MIFERTFHDVLSLARLLAASWLIVAILGEESVAAMPEECAFSNRRIECAYPRPTYQIRLPPSSGVDEKIPVIMILHDAGGSGSAIVGQEGLIGPLLAAGYAVIAPDALPRHNRRGRYGAKRPTLAASMDTVPPFKYSKKKFVMKDVDGTIRNLRWSKDTGWYFWNTDRLIYSTEEFGGEDSDFVGRDEIRALRDILVHAEKTYNTARHATIMAGLGHGGSLVWQVACYAPDMADLFAPVGGAFWHDVPTDCRPGARLIHTHPKNSEFWPIEGFRGDEKRYARTSVRRNLDMLVRTNACLPSQAAVANDDQGFSVRHWPDCARGGPVELIVTGADVAFPGWWLDEITSRVETEADDASEDPEEPVEAGPAFLSVGGGSGEPAEADTAAEFAEADTAAESAEADTAPESAEDAREQAAERRPIFRKPGPDSGPRFKRAR